MAEAHAVWLQLTASYGALRSDLTAEDAEGCIHDTTEEVAHIHYSRESHLLVGGAPTPGGLEIAGGRYIADITGVTYREMTFEGVEVVLPIAVLVGLLLHVEEREDFEERLLADGWHVVPCTHGEPDA